MGQICVQIPPLDKAHTIELEVTVDGKKRLMSYRVESFDWDSSGATPEERIELLKRLIAEHLPEWELVQIGNPTDELIPVLFKQRQKIDAAL